MFLLLEFTSEILSSPSPGGGPAGLGFPPHWSVSGRCRLRGAECVRGPGGSRIWVEPPVLHPFLGSLRSMNSSVQRNNPQTMYNGNMKGFCLNQTEDCTPGDRCSDSSEEQLHWSKSFQLSLILYLNKEQTSNMPGCIPSRLQKRRT